MNLTVIGQRHPQTSFSWKLNQVLISFVEIITFLKISFVSLVIISSAYFYFDTSYVPILTLYLNLYLNIYML